jgi:hypothetical protein
MSIYGFEYNCYTVDYQYVNGYSQTTSRSVQIMTKTQQL